MKRIGVISDTHGLWDDRYAEYFAECDEIWHAGDIGSEEVADKLAGIKPLRAVCGNIDGQPLRSTFPLMQRFETEQVPILLTHIGGYPRKYSPYIKGELYRNPPKLFVCGHSHILKVMYDKDLQMLCVNPGAAGTYGFHKIRTIIRLCIDGANITNLEVIELR